MDFQKKLKLEKQKFLYDPLSDMRYLHHTNPALRYLETPKCHVQIVVVNLDLVPNSAVIPPKSKSMVFFFFALSPNHGSRGLLQSPPDRDETITQLCVGSITISVIE